MYRTRSAFLVACMVSAVSLGSCARTQAPSTTPDALRTETVMANRATGEFDVKVIPQAAEPGFEAVARMLLDKQFHGDLPATRPRRRPAPAPPPPQVAGTPR